MKQHSPEELGRLCARQVAAMDESLWDLFATLVCKGHARLLEERRPDLSQEQRDEASSKFICSFADRMCAATSGASEAVELPGWPNGSLH
jgi:hypothetical protein